MANTQNIQYAHFSKVPEMEHPAKLEYCYSIE